jgi:Zn-dependent membrane protease YugP
VVLGGVALTLFIIWWSEWLSRVAIDFTVRIFRLGGRRGPKGSELASRLLAAAGEGGVAVETSILDSDFRRSFGAIDYQPDTGVLELTKDKARGNTYSSAGLVTLEVGRALQYRSRFPLLFVQRVMAPFANFAGFTWIWPGVATNFVPMYFEEATAATVENGLYLASAAMLGLLLLYVVLRVPLELDGARRGVAALRERSRRIQWSA